MPDHHNGEGANHVQRLQAEVNNEPNVTLFHARLLLPGLFVPKDNDKGQDVGAKGHVDDGPSEVPLQLLVPALPRKCFQKLSLVLLL